MVADVRPLPHQAILKQLVEDNANAARSSHLRDHRQRLRASQQIYRERNNRPEPAVATLADDGKEPTYLCFVA